MKVVNKKMCVIVILILVIIESCTLFLMYKSYSAKETKLDEVNLQERLTKDMFAIMLEQEDGTYKESSDSTWPTSGYKFNADMSGCIDINGNKLDGVLTYDATNNIATVDTGSTSYCYLYFSLPADNLYKLCEDYSNMNLCVQNEILEEVTNLGTIEADLYRYQGTSDNVTNNYICFGTTDKATCTGNTDTYMYRIIGITESGQMKLIKKEALNSTIQWWSDYTTDVTWPNSLIYDAINGSSFLTNTTYVPSVWESKIATHSWKYGDTIGNGNANGDYDGATIYATENGWTNIASAKIGLMYIHDYYYAYAAGGAPGSEENAKTAWIHLRANDSGAPSTTEWTMSRVGYYSVVMMGSSYLALFVNSNGNVNSQGLSNAYSVRPVFYLTSDVKITGGTGTIDDPFLIS